MRLGQLLIFKDSIDLQDQNAPSAQDHTRQPTHPSPLGAGPPAPHQAEALREVAAETADQHLRSPRVSQEWSSGEAQQLQQYGDELAKGVTNSLTGANLQQQDTLAVAQNGGLTGSTAEDAEMADAEGDDGMDDDMMDKISSSPSIDDGGYSLPHMWPLRSDSLSIETPTKGSPSCSQACCESSSPFVETPEYYPLRPLRDTSDKDVVPEVPEEKHHHLPGEYIDYGDDERSSTEDYELDDFSPTSLKTAESYIEQYDHDFDLAGFAENILGAYSVSEDIPEEILGGHSIPEEHKSYEKDGEMTIPYELSEDEDDDDLDILYAADSRFVDSGWGGECLQELEDIDFEFVYALHTFVATVEGQANAAKGDTMVLLDDSNSYWWLVRVVKDSSIGKSKSRIMRSSVGLLWITGYLPAEHIETPTERLARLNKHRNIDVCIMYRLSSNVSNSYSSPPPCWETKQRNQRIR